MVQNDLIYFDNHQNNMDIIDSLYCKRELLTYSCDKLRVDLLTITSVDGAIENKEPLLPNMFPDSSTNTSRPHEFNDKMIIFVSCRVHPGEVPAQHTMKGIINLLLDKQDLCAIELRRKYVFKIIPILNPDGVYRGNFRMDQHGQNLNRYYLDPDTILQPSIFAAKNLIDYYAQNGKLALYLDLHAHAGKRGCFMYGNVMDSLEDQVQNQLFCRLIALNTPHFDYSGCLFSREHMTRIDRGDQSSGLTAEGSGRVATYLAHNIIHSYTLECNYNSSKFGNEIPPCDRDSLGVTMLTSASAPTSTPGPYTPASYEGVGRACLISILDIRGHNPCSRLVKSKYRTLERFRLSVLNEVRVRKEYKGQSLKDRKRAPMSNPCDNDDIGWRQFAGAEPVKSVQVGPLPASIDTSSNDSRISSSQSDNGRKGSSGSRKPVSNARTISAMYKLSIGDDVLNNNSNKNNNISGSNSSISNTTNASSNNNKIVVSQTARAQPAIESEDDCSTSNSTTRAVVVRESKKSMKLNIDMRKKSKLLIQDESGNTSPWKLNSPGNSTSKSNSPKDNSNISLDEKIVKLNQAKVIKAYLKYNTPSSPEFNDLMIDTTTNSSSSNNNSSSNLHAHLLSKVFPDTLSNAFNNNSKRDNDNKSESPVVNTNSSIISNSNSNSNLTRLGRLGLGTVANNSASDLSSLIIDTKKKVVVTNTTTAATNQRPSHIPRIIASTIS